MQPEPEGAVSLELFKSPLRTGGQLKPAIARGIAGRWCGTADLTLLTLTLVYLAIWANGVKQGDSIAGLLSMRLTLAHAAALVLCAGAWRIIFAYCGVYTWQHVQSTSSLFGRVVLATGLSAAIAGGVIGRLWHHGYLLHNATTFWLIAVCGCLTLRAALAGIHQYVKPHFRRRRNAIVIGSGERAEHVCQDLTAHSEWKYKFLGYVDSDPWTARDAACSALGRISDLENILMKEAVDEVVIALPLRSRHGDIERVIACCERVGVQVQYCEDPFETATLGRLYREDYDHRKVVLKMVHDDYRKEVKRAIDIVGAALGLLLFAPLILGVAVLIRWTSEGPVLFTQERYGLNKRTFRIVKFRTMIANAEAAQASLEHMNESTGPTFKIFRDPRITKIGSFLRRTSIDELPQLINILRGEMSFVGPRPMNLRDVGLFSEAWLMRRFSVKPGLTGLWQVSGRSNVSFDRWIALDLKYIDNWSLLLDFRILAMTVPAVIKGTGAA